MPNFLPKPKYRLLLCGRGECIARAQALQLETKLLALLAQYGLDNPEITRYQLVNCLNACHSGPILMVHPDGVIYRQVDEAGLRRIVDEHLLQGRPVAELQYQLPPLQPRRNVR
jgi:(2Fe-2S) ferredoxin